MSTNLLIPETVIGEGKILAKDLKKFFVQKLGSDVYKNNEGKLNITHINGNFRGRTLQSIVDEFKGEADKNKKVVTQKDLINDAKSLPYTGEKTKVMPMSLNLDQTDFVSIPQKAFWMRCRKIVPFEISTAEIPDGEMLEGLRQIFNCINEFYLDVFNDTETYLATNPNFERIYEKAQRENYYYDVASPVFHFFRWICHHNLVDDKWIIEINDGNRNNYGMLDLMESIGIRYENDGETLKIWNVKYPLFTKYYTLFVKSCHPDYLPFLDFRVFNKRKSKSPDDIWRLIPIWERRFATEIYEYALSKGAEPKEPGGATLYYKEKSVISVKSDMGIFVNGYDNMYVNIGSDSANSRILFFEELEKQSNKYEINAHILDEINRCGTCLGNHYSCSNFHDTGVEGEDQYRCIGSFHANTKKGEKYGYDTYVGMLKQIIDMRIVVLDKVVNIPVVEKIELSKEEQQARFDEAVKNIVPRKSAVDLDLTKMAARGEVNLTLTDGQLVIMNKSIPKGIGKTVAKNDIDNSAESSELFSGPIKIELRVKTSDKDIWTFYHQGSLALALKIKNYKTFDPATGKLRYHTPPWKFPVNEFVDVVWYLAQDFMAIVVNGELWHYDEDSDYIDKFAKKLPPPAPVCVSTIASRTKVIVERLRVTEI